MQAEFGPTRSETDDGRRRRGCATSAYTQIPFAPEVHTKSNATREIR